MSVFTDQETFIKIFKETLEKTYATQYETSTQRHKYQTLARLVFENISNQWLKTKHQVQEEKPKQVTYFSMEFLIGRLITNNLHNLGIKAFIEDAFKILELDLNDIEHYEVDPGLGTGGLGRLGACFLDSIASLNMIGHGNGIRYRYGLFEQKIANGYQIEKPDDWLKDVYPWEIRVEEDAIEIPFGGFIDQNHGKNHYIPQEIIRAVPYDIPVVGTNGIINTLRLWNAEPSHKQLPLIDAFKYDEEIRNISGFLYPDDTTDEGKIIRIKQQYFFSAAGIRSILKKHFQIFKTFTNLNEYHVFQINDTHPSLIIPEMMRLMIDAYDYEWIDAWEITIQCCAYTNHTLLSEALEKWPIRLFKQVLPRIYQIIEEIDRRNREMLQEKAPGKIERLSIISHDQIHMAHLAIAGSFSVNGVAALHTKIIKEIEMRDFNILYPNKFNNKTNGITHRRWLKHINKELSQMLDEFSEHWLEEPSELENFLASYEDEIYHKRLAKIKYNHKKTLAERIYLEQGIEINPHSIFDIQVKRLHEYKRQLMNALHIMIVYQRLKTDDNFRKNYHPHTFIFGAKAASTYYYAKKIIKLLNTIAHKVNQDEETNHYLKMVFIENYNVTYAEQIVPACDVSEQISTASKEASGTGNMKFMMNGAITIGTLDGANVEIAELVGNENIIIFGMTSEEYNLHQKLNDYHPIDIYQSNEEIKLAIDQLTNGFFVDVPPFEFEEIRNKLLHKDEYYVLKDLPDYLKAHEKINLLYQNQTKWWKMAIINIAKSGYFSSDRTIKQYADEIWKIKPIKVKK